MKKMLTFCLLGIVVLLCTACPVVYGSDDPDFDNIVTVSGSDKTITKKASSAGGVYSINFDRLIFANTNVTINIIPIEASELAKVDVTYSENLDNYDFDITIANEIISIGA